MAYDAKAVANFFLDLAKSKGKPITPMKLIKLVYIAHGWNFAFKDEPLVTERIEAWQWGPVISSLYHEFKGFGNEAITTKAYGIDAAAMELVEPKIENDEFAERLLKRIWDVYSPFTAAQLSSLTHQPGTPWDITWNELDGKSRRHAVINDELIKDHYRKKREENATGTNA